jgi:hypothetical protein
MKEVGAESIQYPANQHLEFHRYPNLHWVMLKAPLLHLSYTSQNEIPFKRRKTAHAYHGKMRPNQCPWQNHKD